MRIQAHVFPMAGEDQDVSQSLPDELSTGPRLAFRGAEADGLRDVNHEAPDGEDVVGRRPGQTAPGNL